MSCGVCGTGSRPTAHYRRAYTTGPPEPLCEDCRDTLLRHGVHLEAAEAPAPAPPEPERPAIPPRARFTVTGPGEALAPGFLAGLHRASPTACMVCLDTARRGWELSVAPEELRAVQDLLSRFPPVPRPALLSWTCRGCGRDFPTDQRDRRPVLERRCQGCSEEGG